MVEKQVDKGLWKSMFNVVPGIWWVLFKEGQRPCMTWNTGEGGLTVRWPYVVESSSSVVLGPEEFLAFPTRSFTQGFVYTTIINYGCRQASTLTPAWPWNSQRKTWVRLRQVPALFTHRWLDKKKSFEHWILPVEWRSEIRAGLTARRG